MRVFLPIPFSDYDERRRAGIYLAGVKIAYSRDFETQVQTPSKRVSEIAQAFGLGLEKKKLTVYNGFELEIEEGDVIYITGESGGGKSLLLRYIAEKLREYSTFSPVVASWEIEKRINNRKPIIDTLGRNTSEAIAILSAAGLTDTYTWLRRYDELSEGQRFRYIFAKALGKRAKTVILDEFCSTLDRETAKATAYTIQRYVRRNGITLIVATALSDLEQDLNPDTVITKHLGPYVEVRRRKAQLSACSLLDKVVVEEGSLDDWRLLSFLHYRSERTAGASRIYKAKIGNRTIGVVVYSTPYFPAPGFAECFNNEWYMRERFRNVLRISRVVVHPSFRGIGVAKKLLTESMRMLDRAFVEILSTMQLYHNFTKEYMITVKLTLNEKKRKTLEKLKNETGIDANMPIHEIAERIKTGAMVKKIAKWIRENYHIFLDPKTNKPQPRTKQQIITTLQRIRTSAAPKVYAIWINPDEKHRPVQKQALKPEFIEKYAKWLIGK